MAAEHPEKVTGGCLCGVIRYNISFEGEGSWPPMVATCQCWMCRKWTGCLMSTDLVIKRTQVSPDWKTFQTFAEHQSSPGITRCFCSKCGSSVAWFSDDLPEDLIIFVGTIDEEFLMGKVLEDTIKDTEHGKEFKNGPGHAKTLTDPSSAGNLYWQNAIPGITDNLPGPKFLQLFDRAPISEPTS